MEVDWRLTQQTLTGLTSIHYSQQQLLETFTQDCLDRRLSEETIRRYKSSIKGFLNYLQNRGISPYQVDKNVLVEYIRDRRTEGVEQNTVEKDFAAINGLYDFLVFQDITERNIVPGVRKRYFRSYKDSDDVDAESPRKLISVEQMALLINSVVNTRDKAIMTLLAKTGVRRGELIAMDVADINWTEQSITLKRFRKRSNRVVFFDDETARLLKHWLSQREKLELRIPALFIGEKGNRLKRNGIYSMVIKYAEDIGLHDSNSERPEDHFTPHCFRHWFTTHLRRAGMDREFIKILRGDRRRDAISIYDRVDRQELRKAYLAFVPQLGI
jgi:integrase/recombinase XerD